MRATRITGGLACLALFSGHYVGATAKADQGNLVACIKQYTALGISPDAALGECKKSSLSECVQRLLSQKYEAVAIKFVDARTAGAKEKEAGYLIDLGNTESRWLEGKQWASKGCFAYTQGPYKRQSDKYPSFWSSERSYEWFRQGFCRSSKIELEQPYSMEEAKLRCEVGVLQVPLQGAQKDQSNRANPGQ